MTNILINDIIQKIIDSDYIQYGFANLSGLLPEKYKQYTYGISLQRKLDDKIIDAITQGPTLEYFNLYHSVNAELTALVTQIAAKLKQNKINCLAIHPTCDDSSLSADYATTLRPDISHKMVATRAGLGWIGKTDLLITYKYGPRVRLASVLLEYPLELKHAPVVKSECGVCRVCVDKCPGQTSTGQGWNINLDRNQYYDPFKCRETCRGLSKKKINKEISLCGICVAVCPQGKK